MDNYMWISDPKTGKASVTLTMFVVGFIAVTAKLVFSGITVAGIKIADFSGVEYGAAIAALGGVYTLRKRDTIKKDKDSDEQSK